MQTVLFVLLLPFLLRFIDATTQLSNLRCSQASTEAVAHQNYPSFGGLCKNVNGQLKFEVKYCSFPRNNISITEGKVVQSIGRSYEYRCFFSETRVYQQITGCVTAGLVIREGQRFNSKDGKTFVCIKQGAEWYLEEVQTTESVICKSDFDARGVRFLCKNGKLEAIGCIDPFGGNGNVLKDGETLDVDGFRRFVCVKDRILGFKLLTSGCLSFGKKFVPIGQSYIDRNVMISCENSTTGEIIRNEQLVERLNSCTYYGREYKEGEEFNDAGNFTVYKCEQGQLKKIACIVKSNRIEVDRIFYCFDHPYYCMPNGTGISLLQNNGCFNNGDLVKATRKFEKPTASFICSLGPFDSESQTFMFTRSLSACKINGKSITIHNYAKVDGKWMYCDDSRSTTDFFELRELTLTEQACADKYGEHMSFYCVTAENREVNPELSTDIRTVNSNYSESSTYSTTVEPTVKFNSVSVPSVQTSVQPSVTSSKEGSSTVSNGNEHEESVAPTRLDPPVSSKKFKSSESSTIQNSTKTMEPEERRELTSTTKAESQNSKCRCGNGEEMSWNDKIEYPIRPSNLSEEKKKQNYIDLLNSDMCKMLSGYCLDWVEAEAIAQLTPEQFLIKPLILALRKSSNIGNILETVEKIGKTKQFRVLNEQNYHIRRLFNFTIHKLSPSESPCRIMITRCFEGESEGCSSFLEMNCVLSNACPLTENLGSVNSQLLVVLKPFVRHLCAYTCAQWLSATDNQHAAMKSAVKLARYSENCMV